MEIWMASSRGSFASRITIAVISFVIEAMGWTASAFLAKSVWPVLASSTSAAVDRRFGSPSLSKSATARETLVALARVAGLSAATEAVARTNRAKTAARRFMGTRLRRGKPNHSKQVLSVTR